MSRHNHQSASLIVNYIRLIIVMSVFYCFFDNTTRSHNTDNICCTSTVLPLYWSYIRNIPVSYLSAPVCITRHYDHMWHLHRYNTMTQHMNELDNLSPSAPKHFSATSTVAVYELIFRLTNNMSLVRHAETNLSTCATVT